MPAADNTKRRRQLLSGDEEGPLSAAAAGAAAAAAGAGGVPQRSGAGGRKLRQGVVPPEGKVTVLSTDRPVPDGKVSVLNTDTLTGGKPSAPYVPKWFEDPEKQAALEAALVAQWEIAMAVEDNPDRVSATAGSYECWLQLGWFGAKAGGRLLWLWRTIQAG